jgi:hypothetical protein
VDRTVNVSIAAYPTEIEIWKRKAKADGRSLSQWLRRRLIEADARDEELATRLSEVQDARS